MECNALVDPLCENNNSKEYFLKFQIYRDAKNHMIFKVFQENDLRTFVGINYIIGIQSHIHL